jgi:hypothetical protein
MVQITRFEATEAVKAVASRIREDSSLEFPVLQMEDGFMDKAGVASAEGSTIHKTLRILRFDDTVFASRDPVHGEQSSCVA